jgi:hypothetical protein
MNATGKFGVTLATAGLLSSGVAQAALNDRGGGMLYDDVLNITWLQDANYAKTSGYDTDGKMSWSAAKTWADNLVYGAYSDWRLASNTSVGADWNYSYSQSGNTDAGLNITSPHSELSYMYYVNLGLKSRFSATGAYQPDFGVFGNGTYGGENNVGLVSNLQAYFYWSGTAYAPNPATFAWFFNADDALQNISLQSMESYAWAVRPGDVAAPVPEPETYALLLAGLGLLGFVARRRKQNGLAAV